MPNACKMKLSLNSSTIKTTPILDKIRVAGEAGYAGIELWAVEIYEHIGRGGEVSSIFPYRVPLWQLRRMISCEVLPTTPSFFVEYALPGQPPRRFEAVGGVPTPGSDSYLARPPPLLLQKVVSFKSVPVDDHDCGVCHGP